MTLDEYHKVKEECPIYYIVYEVTSKNRLDVPVGTILHGTAYGNVLFNPETEACFVLPIKHLRFIRYQERKAK
jgi:hypothetical protein